jgi:tetratricopeptide (TPR) repeat protein
MPPKMRSRTLLVLPICCIVALASISALLHARGELRDGEPEAAVARQPEEPGPALRLALQIAEGEQSLLQAALIKVADLHGPAAAIAEGARRGINARDWGWLAMHLSRLGHDIEAAEIYLRHPDGPPSTPFETFHEISILARAGRLEEARARLSRSLPPPPLVRPGGGHRAGDYELASMTRSWTTLGETEAASGDLKRAEESFRHALGFARAIANPLHSTGSLRAEPRYMNLAGPIAAMKQHGMRDGAVEVLEAEERVVRQVGSGRTLAEPLAALGEMWINLDDRRAKEMLLEAYAAAVGARSPGLYTAIPEGLYRLGERETAVTASLRLPSGAIGTSPYASFARRLAEAGDDAGLRAMLEVASALEDRSEAIWKLTAIAEVMTRPVPPWPPRAAPVEGPFLRHGEPFALRAYELAKDGLASAHLASVLLEYGRADLAREIASRPVSQGDSYNLAVSLALAAAGDLPLAMERAPNDRDKLVVRAEYAYHRLRRSPDAAAVEAVRQLHRDHPESIRHHNREMVTLLAPIDLPLALSIASASSDPNRAWSDVVRAVGASEEALVATLQALRTVQPKNRTWIAVHVLLAASELPESAQRRIAAAALETGSNS